MLMSKRQTKILGSSHDTSLKRFSEAYCLTTTSKRYCAIYVCMYVCIRSLSFLFSVLCVCVCMSVEAFAQLLVRYYLLYMCHIYYYDVMCVSMKQAMCY